MLQPPSTDVQAFVTGDFRLQSGIVMPSVTIAYRTLGILAPDRGNVVLVTHGNTSGPQIIDPLGSTGEGSWNEIVGPGNAVDTNRFFAICPNMLGSSYGSTNAASIDPATGKPYGSRFPDITVSDIVATQRALLDHLGIEKLVAIVGPSYGGFQALQWAVNYPGMMKGIAAIVTSPVVPRERSQATMARLLATLSQDPNWNGGDYYEGDPPHAGLAIARMIGHITYLSDEQMHAKFGRRLQNSTSFGYRFDTEFQVESYLRYQGDAFVRRFDANSYLYITKSMDYFDLTNGHRSIVEAIEGVKADFLVVSFTGDWLFPSYQSKELVRALEANGVRTSYLDIPSGYGHDAFFLPNPEFADAVRGFLNNALARERQRATTTAASPAGLHA